MLQADRLVGESVEVKSAFGHLAFGFLCHRTVLVSPSGSKIGFRLPSPFDRPSSFRLPRLQLQLQPFGCLTPSTLLIQLVWSCRFSIYLLCLQTRFRFTLLLDVVPFVLLACRSVDPESVKPSTLVGLSDPKVSCRTSVSRRYRICVSQLPTDSFQVLTCSGW